MEKQVYENWLRFLEINEKSKRNLATIEDKKFRRQWVNQWDAAEKNVKAGTASEYEKALVSLLKGKVAILRKGQLNGAVEIKRVDSLLLSDGKSVPVTKKYIIKITSGNANFLAYVKAINSSRMSYSKTTNRCNAKTYDNEEAVHVDIDYCSQADPQYIYIYEEA